MKIIVVVGGRRHVGGGPSQDGWPKTPRSPCVRGRMSPLPTVDCLIVSVARFGKRDQLLVTTPDDLTGPLNLNVRSTKRFRDGSGGETRPRLEPKHRRGIQEAIRQAGAHPRGHPLRPPIPGIDHPQIHPLRTVPISMRSRPKSIPEPRAQSSSAAAISALRGRKRRAPAAAGLPRRTGRDIIPPLNHELDQALIYHMETYGVRCTLSSAAAVFQDVSDHVKVELENGTTLVADLVLLAVGVLPSITGPEAGLECGLRGGVIVDKHMRTSDPDIYAAGDAVKSPIRSPVSLTPVPWPASPIAKGASSPITSAGRPRTLNPGHIGRQGVRHDGRGTG